jgi:hypothetical protein
MRKPILIFVILLSWVSTMAQDKCKDIIYLAENDGIIFNCCIYEVTNGNLVHYTRHGDTARIRADAIIKEGQFIELKKFKQQTQKPLNNNYVPVGLYNGHDYDYYYNAYLNASSMRNCGIVLTFTGIIIEGAALMMKNESVNESDKTIITIMFVAGIVLENIGIPLWIAGGIKRGNNLQVMEMIESRGDLSFGPTRHGVGFRFRF